MKTMNQPLRHLECGRAAGLNEFTDHPAAVRLNTRRLSHSSDNVVGASLNESVSASQLNYNHDYNPGHCDAISSE